MTRRRDPRRPTGDVLDVLDRSNTNPLCPDCDYRTVAVDRTRCACETCGQIVHDSARVVRLLVAVFDGRVIIDAGGRHGAR